MAITFAQIGEFLGAEGQPDVLFGPTSLQFGPDGRLYVTEQSGSIHIFEVAVQDGQYVAVSEELMVDANGDEIIRSIQNHDDDGSINDAINDRQVTGILVTGTAENPEIYVTSSDPRINSPEDGRADTNLDTNSGILSRITWNGTDWEVVDLIRGLPRSEENHSNNGMVLSEDGAKLYMAVGGNTNQGAPSTFFSYTPEYALSGTVLEIDLVALNALPVLTDNAPGQNGRQYVYDLPTLDDPNTPNTDDGTGEDSTGMDEAGPWGGRDGLNQAILPADAPFRIFADGFRNNYDLALTATGEMYTVDNGGNLDLGGPPVFVDGLPTNGIDDTGQGDPEPLYHIVDGGYYGHPVPVRANPTLEWIAYDDSGNPDPSLAVNTVADITSLVPAGVNIAPGFLIDPSKFTSDPTRLAQSGVYISPNDPNSESLVNIGSSSNGLVEYTGDAFDGALQGALLVAQFNGNITVLNVNADGSALDPVIDPGDDGVLGTGDDVVLAQNGVYSIVTGLATPLDVTMGPDGTIWVAEIGGSAVKVFAPSGVAVDDTDADNDGLLDIEDPFSRDPTNGGAVQVTPGSTLVWDFDPNQDGNLPGPSGYGGGLTGAMINGVIDYEDYYQGPADFPDQVIRLDNMKFLTAAGGGTIVIENVATGDPLNGANNGEYLFHTGVTIAPTVESFTITWTVVNPTTTLTGPEQQIGGYIGTGDQSNYLKFAAIQSASGEIVLTLEDGDASTSTFLQADGLFDAPLNSAIVFDLVVDPAAGTATPTVTWSTASGTETVSGAPISLAGTAVLDAINGDFTVGGQTTGLAVGLFASNTGQTDATTFQAIFDGIEISATGAVGETILYRVNAAGDLVAATDDGPDWSADTAAANSAFLANAGSNNTSGFAVAAGATVPDYVPGAIFTSERYDTAGAPSMQWAFDTPDAGFYEVRLFFGNGYDGTATVGSRVFDVSVEGAVPAEFGGIDLVSLFGDLTGGMLTTQVEVTDGVLNLEFLHGVENPLINGIEIVQLGEVSNLPPVSIGADQIVPEESGFAQIPFTLDGSVPAGETVTVFFQITPTTATGEVDFTIDPSIATFNEGTGNYTGSFVFAGSTDASIPVTIVNDDLVEGDELFTATITGVSPNASIGNASASFTIADDDLPEPDTTAPTAVIDPIAEITSATAPIEVVVTYADDVAIDSTSVGVEDMTLSGPGLAAPLAPASVAFDAGTGVATYSFAAPVAGWANGAYTVDLLAAQVADTSGNTVAAAQAAATVNVTTGGGEVLAAINAGGPALVQGGVAFSADAFFTGGGTFTDSDDGNGEQPAFDGTVYETERFGDVSYSIPISYTGALEVELHFAEIYWPDETGAGGVGSRVFDVLLEGAIAFDDVDILAATGGDINTPLVLTLATDSTALGANGALDLSFVTEVDNAKLSGIVVRAATTPDTTAPTAVIDPIAEVTDAAADIVVTVTYSDDVALDGATVGVEDLTLSGPGLAAPLAPASFTFEPTTGVATYSFTAPAGGWTNGAFTVDLLAAEVADTSGNTVAAAQAAVTVNAPATDTTAPTAVIDPISEVTDAAADIVVTVTYSDDVALDGATVGTEDLTLSGPGLAAPLAPASFAFEPTTGVASYSFTAPAGGWTNGAFTVDLLAAEVADTSGNTVAAAQAAVTVNAPATDTTAPTAVIDPISEVTDAAADIVVTVTYSDDVALDGATVGTEDLTLSGPGLAAPLAPASFTFEPTTGVATYSFTAPAGGWTNGAFTVDLLAAEVADTSGNTVAAAQAGVTVNAPATDTTAPTAVIDPISEVTDAAADIVVTVTYSDDVALDGATVGVEDLTLSGPGLAAPLAPASFAFEPTTGVATYSFTAPAGGWTNGAFTVDLLAAEVADTSGNTVAAAQAAVTVNAPASDTTAPTAVIDPIAEVTDSAADIVVTVTYSDDVALDGATVGVEDLTLSGPGLAAPLAPGSFTFEPTTGVATYSFIAPAGGWTNGAFTVDLLAAEVADTSGNTVAAAQAAVTVNAPTPDTTAPTAVIDPIAEVTDAAADIVVTVTYSDDVALDGATVGTEDLTLSGPGLAAPLAPASFAFEPTTGVANYSFTAPAGGWTNGAFTVDLLAAQVADTSGNTVAAAQAAVTVNAPTPDTTAPTAVIDPIAEVTDAAADITVTVTYSDDVALDGATVGTEDLTLSGPGLAAPLAPASFAFEPTTGVANYSFTAPAGGWTNGAFTVDLLAAEVADTSGNTVAAAQAGVTVNAPTSDTTAPTAVIDPIAEVTDAAADIVVTVTYSDDVALDGATVGTEDLTLSGPGLAAPLAPGSFTFEPTTGVATYSFTAPAGGWTNGAFTVDLLAAEVADTSGNTVAAAQAGVTVNAPTPDTTAPTAVIDPIAEVTDAAADIVVTVTYSDDVALDGATVGVEDLTLSGPGLAAPLAPASFAFEPTTGVATYSFTAPVDGWTNGAFTVDLLAAQVADTSGNTVAAAQAGVTVNAPTPDTTAPTAVIDPIAEVTDAAADITVTVTYSDDVALDGATVGVEDLALSGPGLAAPLAPASFAFEPTTGVATYSFTAPAGGWTNGAFTVDLLAAEVADTSGNTVAAAQAGVTVNAPTPDTTAPTAVIDPIAEVTDAAADITVTVTYSDDVALDGATVGTEDLTLSGPGLAAPLAPGSFTFEPTTGVATYSFTAPAGGWTNGAFTVDLLAAEVADTSGNTVAAAQAGVTVNAPTPDTTAPTAVIDPIAEVTDSAADIVVTVTYSDDVALDGATVGVEDLTLSGPGLAAPLAPGSFTFEPTTGVATYSFTAPAGGWTNGAFTVDLLAAEVADTSGNTVAAAQAAVTVNAPTPPPVITLSGPVETSYAEELEDAVVLTVALDAPVAEDVVVTYAVGGAATAGADYTIFGLGQATITAGETSASIIVEILDDAEIETPEDVTVTLQSATQGAVDISAGIDAAATSYALTIVSDDIASSDPIELEAEDFTGVGTDFKTEYFAQAAGWASGQALIRVNNTEPTTVETTLPAGVTAGVYSITVQYFDEVDGQSQAWLGVDGVDVATWIFNDDGPGTGAQPDNIRTITFDSIALQQGSVFSIRGLRDAGEYVRIDKVTFQRTGDLSGNQPPTGDLQDLTVADTGTVSIVYPYSDPESDPLTITPTLAGGAALPGWLTADANGISGTPPLEAVGQTFDIEVSVDDGQGNVVVDSFALTISDTTGPSPSITVSPLAAAGDPIVVTVVYTDASPIFEPSIDVSDVSLDGPSPALGATTVLFDASTNTATYTFDAPAGGWPDGDYQAIFQDEGVEDALGNAAPAPAPTDFSVALGTPDTTAPTAVIDPIPDVSDSAADITVTVTYSDDVALDGATVGTEDLTITGPGLATPLAPASFTFEPTTGVASYSFTAPAGGWTNGAFTVDLLAAEVADTSGNTVAAAQAPVTVDNPGSDTTAPTAVIDPIADVTDAAADIIVTVTYSDDVALDDATVGTEDLTLSGPGLAAPLAPASFTFEPTTGVASYSFTAPAGGWTNGAFTVDLLAAEVADTSGNTVAAAQAPVTVDNPGSDTTAPTAVIDPIGEVTDAAADIVVTVTYSDDVALDGATVGTEDLTLSGPGLASPLAPASFTFEPTTGVATYSFTAPAGGWTNGAFTVDLLAAQVADTSGNTVAAAQAGATVNAPASDTTAPTAVIDPIAEVTDAAADITVTVTYSDDVALDGATVGTEDLTLSGPGLASPLAPASFTFEPTTGVASYSFTAPAGGWANGAFTVDLLAAQVADTSGNTVAAAQAAVTVNEPDEPTEAEAILFGLTDVDSDGAYGAGAVGAAQIAILPGTPDVGASNYDTNSFTITNTGDKQIAAVFIDVRDAVFSNSVFDIDGASGDDIAKIFEVETEGGTGGFFIPGVDGAYFLPGTAPLPNNTGTGMESDGGYRGLVIRFSGADGGFANGETVGFSGDMDPNSIAGLLKGDVEFGALNTWDIGGVSGAELSGTRFTVLFDDGTTAGGVLNSDGSQGGGVGEAVQGRAESVATVTVNGFAAGQAGTYGGATPEIIVSGAPGDTVRVVLSKAFNPVINNDDGIADLVRARLAASHPDFQINNAFDVQTVDVVIGAGGTTTLAPDAFDYNASSSGIDFPATIVDSAGGPITLPSSQTSPIAVSVAVIDAASGFALGPVDRVYLTNPSATPVGSASSEIASNTAPTVGTAIAPLAATESEAFVFTVPDEAFEDAETDDLLNYSATGLPIGLTMNEDGEITGAPGENGDFTVTVTATDPGGLFVSQTVGLTVAPAAGSNTAPTVGTAIAPQSATVGTEFSFTVPDEAFVDAETDDALTYTATGLPAGIELSTAGVFSGAPSAAGTFPVTITATDPGGLATEQIVEFSVAAGTVDIPPGALVGTEGPDTSVGASGADDVIYVLGGDDDIDGFGGNDTIFGGEGNDTLDGSGGADQLFGEGGDDTLNGGSGGDTLDGGPGNDTLNGAGGPDVFVFRDAFGVDTVTNFRQGQDLVEIYGSSFASAADAVAALTQDGANVTLEVSPGNVIIFLGEAVGAFSADDFSIL